MVKQKINLVDIDKLQKKNNNKLYSLVNKNIETVLDILQKKGYSITK